MKVNPDQLLEDGYIVLRNVVPPDRLEELRNSYEVLVDRQREIWASERKPEDPPGGAWETSAQPRLVYNERADEATANTVEFCLHENTLGVSHQLMRAPDVGIHAMFLMCSPVRDHGPQRWHRDTGPDADAPLEGLHQDMMANGVGYVQWNIPLYDDNVLWILPGSHRHRNTEAVNDQLRENPRAPLPGSIPVELKAGDGVAYTNFILHWGSDYTTRLRRTIHLGYQSFGGPLYRYFHLWWELGFTQNLPSSLRAPFERWTQCIAREHAIIERIYRAILNRDIPAFQAGLTDLHPGKEGRMTCVIILCKVAQKLHALTRPEFATLPPAEQDKVVHWRTRHLYLDVTRRFTAEEIDLLCQRFGALDARLLVDGDQSVVATQLTPTKYRIYEMPVDFGVEDFIASWAGPTS